MTGNRKYSENAGHAGVFYGYPDSAVELGNTGRRTLRFRDRIIVLEFWAAVIE